MKTEKQPSSSNKKNNKDNKQGGASKKKHPTAVDTRSSAMDNTKARTGRGLANEGTITSYDEER